MKRFVFLVALAAGLFFVGQTSAQVITQTVINPFTGLPQTTVVGAPVSVATGIGGGVNTFFVPTNGVFVNNGFGFNPFFGVGFNRFGLGFNRFGFNAGFGFNRFGVGFNRFGGGGRFAVRRGIGGRVRFRGRFR